MAHIEPNGRRRFRHILAPDMTPMVGIGFLLVAFFLLTSAIAKPTVMQVTMPVDAKDIYEGCGDVSRGVMSVVLGKHNQVYYYYGLPSWTNEQPQVHTTDLSASGLRQVLLKIHKESGNELFILIKPSNQAKYQNLVDILDEMNITGQQKYAVVDTNEQDEKLTGKL